MHYVATLERILDSFLAILLPKRGLLEHAFARVRCSDCHVWRLAAAFVADVPSMVTLALVHGEFGWATAVFLFAAVPTLTGPTASTVYISGAAPPEWAARANHTTRREAGTKCTPASGPVKGSLAAQPACRR